MGFPHKSKRAGIESRAMAVAFVEDMDQYTFLRQEEEAYRKRVVVSDDVACRPKKHDDVLPGVS